MKIIEQCAYLESKIDTDVLKFIEKIGRTCYKSEDKITNESAEKFVRNLIKNGHESVLEHYSISLRLICDRGVSHEIVRHRIASYSQESTRYCNYSEDKFGKEITFIKPIFNNELLEDIWTYDIGEIEDMYFQLLDKGATPELARQVLPNSLKTEIVATMNLREWRHFIKLRTSPAAHPQMRDLAFKILKILKDNVPVLFEEM